MENEQKGKRVHSSETESLSSSDDGLFVDETPHQQITNNDLESLHEKVCLNHICLMPCQPNRSLTERLLYAISYQVVNLLSRCTCPVQFYLEHLSEGKYRIGDTRTLIFVRVCFNIYSFDLLSIIQPFFSSIDFTQSRYGSCRWWMVSIMLPVIVMLAPSMVDYYKSEFQIGKMFLLNLFLLQGYIGTLP